MVLQPSKTIPSVLCMPLLSEGYSTHYYICIHQAEPVYHHHKLRFSYRQYPHWESTLYCSRNGN